MRLLFALALVFLAPSPAVADGGPALEALIAAATGVNRTSDATLTAVAMARTADADFTHANLNTYGLGAWRWGEVIGWNRYAADPYAYVVAGWMGSSPHREILTDPFYTRIGCDHRIVADPNGGDAWDYFVCIVGTPAFILPDTALPK